MRHDPSYLVDMLLAARNAVEFTGGLTQQKFEQDTLRQNAVAKAVEIVGDAASRLSVETKAEFPEIEWDKMIRMRSRLAHGYFAINCGRVWKAVQDDLPKLISQLESIVPPEPKRSN